MGDVASLQKALGYQFCKPKLLSLALTHSSAGGQSNERLEFLGDSIINYIIAEALYRRVPSPREGEMTIMRASLVREATLAEVAIELQLGDYLRMGTGERRSGGQRRNSMLADALEAVVGAILLDSDVEQCRSCVLAWFAPRLQQSSLGTVVKDAKTRLQEYLQGRDNSLPKYEVVSVQGEGPAQQFHVACHLHKLGMIVEGVGATRRQAEQNAATSALERLPDHGG